jgi:hypothetical protein
MTPPLLFLKNIYFGSYDGEEFSFNTVLSAFWYVFYNFSSRGVLGASLNSPHPKSSAWLPRIAFDTAYFVWVGIILFTTFTALLVDALGQLRTETSLRVHEVLFFSIKRPS